MGGGACSRRLCPASTPEASSGDTLLHSDLRADTLLFSPSGSVVFLDWPSACRGVDWFDPLRHGAQRDHAGRA